MAHTFIKRSDRRKLSQGRAARRGSLRGRELERTVTEHLERMKNSKQITDYIAHQPNSKEDHEGRDFTVRFGEGECAQEHSFGVTISLRKFHRTQGPQNQVKQFCFPIGTNRETIIKRILGLRVQN